MFLARRDLAFARGRFALMGLVIALIAVLGVMLTGLATGLATDGISGLRAMPVTHLAFESAATGDLFSRSTVTLDDVAAYASAPGVEQAAPFGNQLTHAEIATGDNEGKQLSLAVFGVDPATFLNPTPEAGAPLESDVDGILISEALADEGIAIGDTLMIDRMGLPLTVVGRLGTASFGHIPVAYAPLATWQKIHYGLPGTLPLQARQQATSVALQMESGVDVSDVDSARGLSTIARVASYNASPGYEAESSTMTLIRGFLYVISALVVGAFFTVWTVQRRPEIALLKALGASTQYILRDALAQVVTVLLSATLIGSVMGWLLGLTVPAAVPFSLEIGPVVVASALLVLLGVLGASVAVRRITSVDPLAALGDQR